MADLNTFRENLRSLVSKFEQDKNHYLQKGYPEAQVRIDFLNPVFEALGWDIENKAHKPPHERDVIVELSPKTSLRPDYNFRINGATKLGSLVDRMLDLHKKMASTPPSAEREKVEREIAVTDEKIDEIMYGLHAMTEEERMPNMVGNLRDAIGV